MKLHYKIFGKHTGLRVSEFSLGTGMFGTQWGYGAEPEEARRIFDAYAEAGGNFIDTADGYQFGQSEQLVGEFLGAERDNFVVATKYTGGAVADGGVSVTGNSRKNMIHSAEASLRRLGTDRIDLYWVHFPDAVTPIDEIVLRLDDLSRKGKIIYAGFSDFLRGVSHGGRPLRRCVAGRPSPACRSNTDSSKEPPIANFCPWRTPSG